MHLHLSDFENLLSLADLRRDDEAVGTGVEPLFSGIRALQCPTCFLEKVSGGHFDCVKLEASGLSRVTRAASRLWPA